MKKVKLQISWPDSWKYSYPLPKFSDCLDPSQFEAKQFQPNADGHIFLLHLDEIELLARQAGLVVVETKLFNNSLTNGHLKLRALLNILPRPWIEGYENLTNSMPSALQKKLHTSTIALLKCL